MRLGIKILLIIIVTFTILFIATYTFLVFKGKAIITRQLEELTHKKVSIDYFGLIWPLHLVIKNLNIEDLAKVDTVFISPNILGFVSGSLAFNSIKVIRPEFTFKRLPPPAIESTAQMSPVASPAIKTEKKPPLRLIIKRLKIKEGRIDFTDQTVGVEGIKIILKDIDFSINNLYVFPRSVITNFHFKGKIPWQVGKEEGTVEAEGWLNLFKKDMQAALKIEDIDGISLYPYYSQWVDLEKARIEKAKLNFTSNIHGLNNDVVAQCRLELTDIVRKPRPAEEQAEKAERIADAVLDIFKALNQGKIVLDFTIKTKMDRPEFGFGHIKMAFEDKLAQVTKSGKFNIEDVLMLPGKIIEGTVKSATDITKAVIIGTVSVGKELKKTVEDAFKKEKKE